MELRIIKQRRKELGLTAKQLSQNVGLATSSVSEIERGRVRGKEETIRKLAEALGLSYYDIRKAQDDIEIQNLIRPNNAVFERTFKPGKLYRLELGTIKGYGTLARAEHETLRYTRKSGKHHMFKHPTGGWLTSFTDTQLIGVVITERGK